MPFSWDICSVWSLSLDISFWWQQIQQIGKRRQEKRWAEIELARERDVARQSPTKISRHCSTHRCSFACPKCKFSLCLWHFRPRPATGLHVYNIFQYIYLREREREREQERASEGRRERGKEGRREGGKEEGSEGPRPFFQPCPGLLRNLAFSGGLGCWKLLCGQHLIRCWRLSCQLLLFQWRVRWLAFEPCRANWLWTNNLQISVKLMISSTHESLASLGGPILASTNGENGIQASTKEAGAGPRLSSDFNLDIQILMSHFASAICSGKPSSWTWLALPGGRRHPHLQQLLQWYDQVPRNAVAKTFGLLVDKDLAATCLPALNLDFHSVLEHSWLEHLFDVGNSCSAFAQQIPNVSLPWSLKLSISQGYAEHNVEPVFWPCCALVFCGSAQLSAPASEKHFETLKCW